VVGLPLGLTVGVTLGLTLGLTVGSVVGFTLGSLQTDFCLIKHYVIHHLFSYKPWISKKSFPGCTYAAQHAVHII